MLHFPFGLLFLVDISYTAPLVENTLRWNDREIVEGRHQSGNIRRAAEGRGRMYDGRTGGGVTAFLHQLKRDG